MLLMAIIENAVRQPHQPLCRNFPEQDSLSLSHREDFIDAIECSAYS